MSAEWVTEWGVDLAPEWALGPDGQDSGGGDGDAAFDNSAHVPDAQDIIAALAEDSAAFRTALGARAQLGIAYGDHPREALDLFVPDGTPQGLMIFIHGGYWQMRARSDWSALAQGALERGLAVAMPSYPLAPEVSVPRITQSVAQAVVCAADRVPGPIYLCGHSAGGHLAARMACADGPLPEPVALRLRRVTSISGLHDLRPFLRAAKMNKVLRLDTSTAAAESPALRPKRPDLSVGICVGAEERPELIRQSQILARSWDCVGELRILPELNHFSIVDGLRRTKSPLLGHILAGQDCDMTSNMR